MTYKGRIKNGVVVLDEAVRLPEGSQVLVQPVEEAATLGELLRDVVGKGNDLPDDGSTRHGSPALADGALPLSEVFKDLIGSDADLAPDAARNKRHYLYGHRKS